MSTQPAATAFDPLQTLDADEIGAIDGELGVTTSMTGYQLLVTSFALISLAVSGWAIWCVAKSRIRYKPAWIISSLFGFVGLGLNCTKPDDLILLFGLQIPPVVVFKVLATQFVLVKVQFPIAALVALGKSEFGEAGRQSGS